MVLREIIKKRYQCRRYDPTKEISRDFLMDLAELATLAPSADNRQAYRFYLLNKQDYDLVRGIIHLEWVFDAPWTAFLFSVCDEAYIRHYDGKCLACVDAAIAFDHFVLLLTEEGIGTAWLSTVDGYAVVQALRLPKSWTLEGFSPVGYPNEPPPEHRVKRRVEELVMTEPPSIKHFMR